jgi:hypothetical protein
LIVLVCLSGAAVAQKAPPSKPFERFDGCALEPDEWTDGDSFRVRLPDGRLETFRLYFYEPTLSPRAREAYEPTRFLPVWKDWMFVHDLNDIHWVGQTLSDR